MYGAPAFVRSVGRIARSLGKSLDSMGLGFQDGHGYVEKRMYTRYSIVIMI